MTAPAQDRTVALPELQELWQLSFQKTTRGIAVSAAATGLTQAVNPAFAAMHGGVPEDFVGKPLSAFLSPGCIARIPEVMAELEHSGFAGFESDHVRLDGSVFRVAAEMMAVADDEGRPAYRIGWFTDLSERSKDQRRRREAERQFETAFAKAAMGVALVGLDGRWLRANPAFCEITGYDEAELYDLTFTEITHPDDLAANVESDMRLLSGEANDYQLEKRYLHKDGSSAWVLLAVSLLRDDHGEPVHYIVHVHDISLRKRIEEDLLRAARGSHVSRDLMCTTTADGQIGRIEGRWQEVLGWTEHELRSRRLIEFVHPEDRTETAAELDGLAAADGGWRVFRNRWKTKDGSWCWLAWSAIGSPGGGAVFCSVREVDDRVAIEQALELRSEVIANMAEGVCLVTAENMRIVYANPSLERMLGYGSGELNGRDAVEVMRYADISAEEEVARSQAEVALREMGSASYEGRRTRRDGTTIWCRSTTTTFDHPKYGAVWVAVQQDVTEERRAREAAVELERAKTEFLGSISHELRTPLTSILGYAALLREDTASPERAREHIEVIERNATRQLRLVEDLLSIARIEAGEFEIRRLPVDLSEVVALGSEALRPAATDAGLQLDLDLERPVPVVGDSDRLAQVVTNLVSNAIKFTPAGGRIEVSLRASEEEALLRVLDTGPGVRPAERAQLFERFSRGAEVKRLQTSGAGLGLAIARSIVEAHSGRIGVRNADGAGATFEVAIPRSR